MYLYPYKFRSTCVKMVTNNLSVVKILKIVFNQLDSQTVGLYSINIDLLLSTGENI